jgi:hypothetical protein
MGKSAGSIQPRQTQTRPQTGNCHVRNVPFVTPLLMLWFCSSDVAPVIFFNPFIDVAAS